MTREAPYGWVPGKERYRAVRYLFDCALYGINLRVTCRCGHSAVLDGPGRWYQAEKRGWDDDIRLWEKSLYCRRCLKLSAAFVRHPRIAQTVEGATEPLLPRPDPYEWKRIVNRQRS